MNKTIMINRLNPELEQEDKKWIFFMLGDIYQYDVDKELVPVLEKTKLVSCENTILKYNGIEVFLKIEDIPTINSALTNSGFKIYSIYEVYDPTL